MKPGVLGGSHTVRRANSAVIPKADLYVLISVGTCWDVLSYVSDGGRAPPELSYLKVTQSLLEKVVAISGVPPVTFGHPHRSDILKRRRYYWNAGLLSSRHRKAPDASNAGAYSGKDASNVLCMPARPAHKPRGEAFLRASGRTVVLEGIIRNWVFMQWLWALREVRRLGTSKTRGTCYDSECQQHRYT